MTEDLCADNFLINHILRQKKLPTSEGSFERLLFLYWCSSHKNLVSR